MGNPFFHPSNETEEALFFTLSAAEGVVCILSIGATALHYRGAKKVNRVTKFHFWHSFYCVWITTFKCIEAYAYLHGFQHIHNVLGFSYRTCWDHQINQIWCMLPVHVLWAVALYYFFAHFDFILIRERPMGRRGRLRMYTYGTYLLFVVVINCTIGSIRYEGNFNLDGKSKCANQIDGTLYMSWDGILVILLVEMVCLTANFWKVAYHDDRNKTGSQRSAKTHLKMTACVVTTASILLALSTAIIAAIAIGYLPPTVELLLYAVPSYFTLFFLWDRHYISESTRHVHDDEDDHDREADEDDDDDDNEIEDEYTGALSFSSYTSARGMEMHPLSAQASGNPLRDPIDAAQATKPDGGVVLILPQQSSFNLRALLGMPQKLFIDEDLRPPDSTPTTVRLFISAVAIPVAEAYQRQHEAETSKLLQRYGGAQQRRGSSDQETDAMAALEKQAQFDELKEQAQALSLQVGDWVAALRKMLQALPTDPIVTRDDRGVKEGWRPFKPSSAKKKTGVALWPTNLHTCSAVVRAPATRPLALTVTTYGAPSAHAFGFKHGGWGAAEKKLQSAAGAAPGRSTSGLMMPARQRSRSSLGRNAEEALNTLRLKFNVSGRSCVCMSQALAAAVAAAVHKLNEVVTKRDGTLVRQWISIGMLVHEISLLSTYGNENGMIDDMATALNRLNLTLRIEPSGDATASLSSPSSSSSSSSSSSLLPSEGIFHVTDLSVVPPSDDSSDGAPPTPSIVGGKKVVTLKVHSSETFAWLLEQVAHTAGGGDLEEGLLTEAKAGGALDIEVHPVLMTLGVNEMQTVANAAGDTSIQTDINRRGLQGLRRHLQAFREFRRQEKRRSTPMNRHGTLIDSGAPADEDAESGHDEAAANTCTALLASLEGLIDSEASLKQRKTVDLLMKSCFAARLLNGARTTSCKSAKDRTSMFYTLELVRLAEERGLLTAAGAMTMTRRRGRGRKGKGSGGRGNNNNNSMQQDVLELLRGVNGVRLQNCKHNIGKAAFSFNKVQVAALPKELQPPLWTISGASSSS